VTASEFAFLALGLVLGVASGAALSIVIRARPPAPREVRVTVSTDAVPRRLPATLSGFAEPPASVVAAAARGGPADPTTLGAVEEPTRTPVPSGPESREPVAIPIRPETDALVEALDAGSTVAVLDRALAAVGSGRSSRAMADGEPPTASRPIGSSGGAGGSSGAGAAASSGGARSPGDGGPAAGGPSGGAPTGPDPCADERRSADERCALADRLKEAAQVAADRAREAQRAYDEHTGRSSRAASVADPRNLRATKEAAWTEFRRSNAAAQTREGVEAAARDWLQEIDRINRTAQEAEQEALRERTAAGALVNIIERVSLEADAARINAETAAEACLVARETLATCEEIHRTPPPGGPIQPAEDAAEVSEESARLLLVGGPGFEPGGPAFDEDAPHRVFGDREPAILKLLRGDRGTMIRVVAALAAGDPAEQRRWQLALSGLVDAIIARAIEASALEFPRDHPFWGTFSQAQSRDVATALASFGYRFDGMGGFIDGRVPSQRDLSLAVGYAGFDPMRIRTWPNEQESPELYRGVAVSAGEFLAAAAGGLTLGEMVGLLRDRAESLTDLWNAWGRVRPLLLEP
jgi:hypothetical protein